MEAIKRSKFAEFLNVGTKESPSWARIGKGVSENTVAYSANVTSEIFINEDNGSNSVDSYSLNIPVTQYAYKGEPVFDYVDRLRQSRATGTEAETEILLVYVYDTADNTTYKAEKNDAVISIESFGGAGGQRVQIGYNILFNGDPEVGTATITGNTVTFTKG